MPETRTPEETAYLEKIIERALWAVVRAGAVDDDAPGGAIDFPLAVKGLCDVIATLGIQSGNFITPRDMRLFSEDAGKEILSMMKLLAARADAGEPLDWKPEPIDKPN